MHAFRFQVSEAPGEPRTNTDLPPSQAVPRHRDPLRVKELFRRAKSALRTRPIRHSSDAAIRGHVFCSFPALVLQQEVIDGCRAAGLAVAWADLMPGSGPPSAS